MARLRDNPPTTLGGLAVDLVRRPVPRARTTCRRPTASGTGSPRTPASSSARRGTEPKLKAYLEVVIPVHPDDGVDAARISAAGRLDAIKGDVRRALGL